MSERIPTAEDIRLAMIEVGYTHYEADDAIEALKRRYMAAGHDLACEAVREATGGAVRKLQRIAWDEGWEAAVGQAPGDTWFDEWHYQTNPYREGGAR